MKRDDFSHQLYHWIKTEVSNINKDEAYESAFEILVKILSDGFIKGSSKFITGGDRCVCFTESPEYFMDDDKSDYQPFGISFLKEDIFIFGGRPVIYQPYEELKYLDESIWWKYVQYDPWCSVTTGNKIDFSWEREWRIKTDELAVIDSVAVIVPNQEYLCRLQYELDDLIENSMYENYETYQWAAPSYPYSSYDEKFFKRINLIKKKGR